jgi:fido (protein-threonine AMPylation protein)
LPVKLLSELEATQAKLRSLLMFNNGNLRELHKDIYGEVYNLYANNSAFLQTTKDLTKIPLL